MKKNLLVKRWVPFGALHPRLGDLKQVDQSGAPKSQIVYMTHTACVSSSEPVTYTYRNTPSKIVESISSCNIIETYFFKKIEKYVCTNWYPMSSTGYRNNKQRASTDNNRVPTYKVHFVLGNFPQKYFDFGRNCIWTHRGQFSTDFGVRRLYFRRRHCVGPLT